MNQDIDLSFIPIFIFGLDVAVLDTKKPKLLQLRELAMDGRLEITPSLIVRHYVPFRIGFRQTPLLLASRRLSASPVNLAP